MNHNKCNQAVIDFIPFMNEAYDRIILEYSKYCGAPMAYADCYIYAQAIMAAAAHKQVGVDEALKAYVKSWHIHNKFFIICSIIDSFVTLKLKHLDVLGSILDATYEDCRIKGTTANIEFMYQVTIARMQLTVVDNDKLKETNNQAWFAGCLEILRHLKKARNIAIVNNIEMHVIEAFVDMQIHVINMNMVEPYLKKGLTYDAVNFLAYHHLIPKEVLRKALEPNAAYLSKKYSKEPLSKIITKPYHFDPQVKMAL